jgi:multiple sugar transport system permease protein
MDRISSLFSGKREGRAFLAPTVLLLLALTVFPFIFSLWLTFSKVSFVGGLSIHLVGFRNWARLFSDERFWNASSNTIFFVALAVGLEYVLGLGLAILLSQSNIRGRSFFRVLFLTPMMLAPIAVGYMGRMMFNQTRGPVNHILTHLGLPAVAWLTDTGIAMYSIVLMDVWQWTPFMFLILFAGLQTIPSGFLEAARVDGASRWQLFRHIIFPLLAPASLAAILIRVLEAFKVIDTIYIMTGGGPGISTESMTLFGYSIGLTAFDLAYGSTIAFSLFVMVLVLSIALLLMTRRYQEVTFE